MEIHECFMCKGKGLISDPFTNKEVIGDDVIDCPNCEGTGKIEYDETLTDAQVEQIDLLHVGIYELMCQITHRELDWNVEWIGELADTITQKAIELTGLTEMEIYPYHEEGVKA